MSHPFLKKFVTGDIDAGEFGHRDHVFAAWLMLQEMPFEQAAREYAASIQQLAAKFGVPGKYHATVTHALMIIINDRLDTAHTWDDFYRVNADLATDAWSLLGQYYSQKLLQSDEARQCFVDPDIETLPLPVGSLSARLA